MSDTIFLVQSMDRARKLWDPWFFHWNRWWGCTDTIDTFFMSQCEPAKYRNVHTVLSGKKGAWGREMRAALDQLTCLYIIMSHEDYFHSGPTDSEAIHDIVAAMDRDGLQLVKSCGYDAGYNDGAHPMQDTGVTTPDGRDLWLYNHKSMYLISHQISVWRKSFLESTISLDDSPWDHELAGTDRLRVRSIPIYAYRGPAPIPYVEIMQGGKVRGALQQRMLDEAKV